MFHTPLQALVLISGTNLANSSCKMSQRHKSSSVPKCFVKDSHSFLSPLLQYSFTPQWWIPSEYFIKIIFITTVLARSLLSLHFPTNSLFSAVSHFKALYNLSPSSLLSLHEQSRCWITPLINLLPIFQAIKQANKPNLLYFFFKLHQLLNFNLY